VFDKPNLTTKCIQSVLAYLWVLGMELPACHPFGAQNFEVALRFSEHLLTHAFG